MRNNGLFSTLFIDKIRSELELDDAGQGRMATLYHAQQHSDRSSADSIWSTHIKQALSYLSFVPPGQPDAPGVYLLYEDYSFSNTVSVLYLIEPGADLDDVSIGRFWPGKLIAQLRDRKLNWGILTDGGKWRLYTTRTGKPFEEYVELNLAEALAQNDEKEYALFERFFHVDSFTAEIDGEETDRWEKDARAHGVYNCRLDQDIKASEKILEDKVKSPLLEQIDEVLQYLCNGFISETPRKGDEYTDDERREIFESAVKLLYRCLFLFYAEARSLLPSQIEKREIYAKHSIGALCLEAHRLQWRKRTDDEGYDLWKHLKGLIGAVNEGDPEYGIMGYNGGLFDDEAEKFLGKEQLRNDFLARALYLMAWVEPHDSNTEKEYRIPYRDLEVRHLGEMYETILEFSVTLADADRLRRRSKKGVEILLASGTTRQKGDGIIRKGDVYFGESALERKQTGSYYTPESLVHFLNAKAIISPLRDRFENNCRERFNLFSHQAKTGHDATIRRGATQSAIALVERFVREVILCFKLCDPAMGSGHFLVNAANQLTDFIVSLFAEIPIVEGMASPVNCEPNVWRRLVTRHCLYGVDLNPLAVHLAKLSLWLNGFARDHKLTFLDHHLRCGNSLIGIRSLSQLEKIPERNQEAKKKRKNAKRQLELPLLKDLTEAYRQAAQTMQSISQVAEDDTDRQKEMHEEVMAGKINPLLPLADLSTAYLMDDVIKPDDYRDIFLRLSHGERPVSVNELELHEKVKALTKRHHFFHWALEFPDVFNEQIGGFDAAVGNPPWDTWNPKTQEFFSSYDPSFRTLTKTEAGKRAEELCKDLNIKQAWHEYQSLFYEAACFFQNHPDYAHQDIKPPGSNLYKLFVERDFHCLGPHGRIGIILPAGFYSDSATKGLREFFFDTRTIESIYCFENRFPVVFKSVHNQFKFITLCIVKDQSNPNIRCAFMQHDPETLPAIEKRAIILKPEDIVRFSPDSLSLTEFNAQRDIEIAGKIYADFPLLGNTDASLPWRFPLLSVEFNMTHQSSMFVQNVDGYVLYEGKMINQFDHLFSSNSREVEKRDAEQYLRSKEMAHIGKNSVLGKSVAKLIQPIPLPFTEFRFGVRAIAASTNERALISTVLPSSVCCGNSLFTSIPWEYNKDVLLKDAIDNRWKISHYSYAQMIFVVSLFNSFCYDWLMRMKISTNLNVFILNQLPMPRLTDASFYFSAIVGRALRLICTTSDFALFWERVFCQQYQEGNIWYPEAAPIDTYGPTHEQQVRRRLRDEAMNLTQEWKAASGAYDRTGDRRDTGDRAQLRAEIDAYVAHLFGLTRDEFAYIIDTFPVMKRKEEQAFGEFISKRKCLEEYDRIASLI